MQDELAATAVELIDAWGRAMVTVLGGKPQGQPLRVPRPGDAQRAEPQGPQRATSPEDVARFFAKHVNTG